jgi:hypothetical protein
VADVRTVAEHWELVPLAGPETEALGVALPAFLIGLS